MLKKDNPSNLSTVKIHGIFDTTQQKLVKVSLDESDIDMELLLLGEKPCLKQCVLEVALLLDAVGV